jgi:hypothetical protein
MFSIEFIGEENLKIMLNYFAVVLSFFYLIECEDFWGSAF